MRREEKKREEKRRFDIRIGGGADSLLLLYKNN